MAMTLKVQVVWKDCPPEEASWMAWSEANKLDVIKAYIVDNRVPVKTNGKRRKKSNATKASAHRGKALAATDQPQATPTAGTSRPKRRSGV